MESIKSNSVVELFSAQYELLAFYQQIEGLPSAPIDINTKSGRKLLKDFVARFTEELSEAYEMLEEALRAITQNHKIEAIKRIRDFNLEVGDANHFLIEFLIYAGYGSSEHLEELLKKFIREEPIFTGQYSEGKVFKSLLGFGNLINFKAGQRSCNRSRPDLYTIADENMAAKDKNLSGGRYISEPAVEIHQALLWKTVCSFHLTLNVLKSKEWSQEKTVDKLRFEEALTKALVHYFIYLDFAGFTEMSIVTSFREVSNKLWVRIKGGY